MIPRQMLPSTERGSGEAAMRRRVDRMVHRVLIAGMTCSSLLLAAGVLVGLSDGEALPRRLDRARGLAQGIAHLHPDALLTAGLVVLILTPIVRVVGSAIAFLTAKDFRFALVTTAVLVTIAASLWWGKG